MHHSAPLAGQSLAESYFQQQFDGVVIGISDADPKDMAFNPASTPATSLSSSATSMQSLRRGVYRVTKETPPRFLKQMGKRVDI